MNSGIEPVSTRKLLETIIGAPLTRDGLKLARSALRGLKLGTLLRFRREFKLYRAGSAESLQFYAAPRLDDRTEQTPVDLYYFYQDLWGLNQALEVKPSRIVEIGSTAFLVGVLAQHFDVTSIDIRPLPVELPRLECRKGSILELPFEDASVEYINSLCVIEHIGLGRYGDPLDPKGIEKAITELRRVIAPGGRLVTSVPLGPSCVAFNSHRVFEREEFLALWPEFEVEAEVFCVPGYADSCDTGSMKPGKSHVYCVRLKRQG